ncbi:hypothetical protein TNCV_4126961 [Trichonephila clavipes]|uniref:Uncharacterized protein n=1 Tax=Trichonephila clavipes TaxID=2585209 RepID=A0A8X6VMT0_TRICX|nr:hypothetical protein TNCV_4126961 [Trichonephila clavipes]
MATPGSSFTPTPLGHEDNLEVRRHPWANTLQAFVAATNPYWAANFRSDPGAAKAHATLLLHAYPTAGLMKIPLSGKFGENDPTNYFSRISYNL